MELNTDELKRLLSKNKRVKIRQKQFIKSAILALIEKDEVSGEYYTYLIKRAEDGGAHSGQIAFPGGKYTTKDIFLKHTALREANEEIGIETKHLKILGKLSDVSTKVSNYRITPFVAYSKEKLVKTANTSEVTKIIEVKLTELLEAQKVKRKISDNDSTEVHYGYIFDGYFVWGATAKILDEFIELLKKAYK